MNNNFIRACPFASLRVGLLRASLTLRQSFSLCSKAVPLRALRIPHAYLKILFLFPILFSFAYSQKIQSGKKFFKKFYQAHLNKIPQHYEFKQENEHFKNDSLYGSSTWYEEIHFPKYFRIQFGMNNGNYVLFQNDSSYRYDFGELKEKKYAPNRLLFMIGGVAFYPYPTTLQKVNSFGIDLNISYSTELEGKKVRVIGAKPNDFTKNQWWIDEKTYQIVRILDEVAPQVMMRFDFKSYECIDKKFYIENEVWIYQNEVLIQKEYYKDIKIIYPTTKD